MSKIKPEDKIYYCQQFLDGKLSEGRNLYDRRIVAYCIGDSNNNHLVFETFDNAVKENPNAHPLFHSDRGFSIPVAYFMRRLKQQVWYKACQEWRNA